MHTLFSPNSNENNHFAFFFTLASEVWFFSQCVCWLAFDRPTACFFLCSESRYVYALWMCERFSLPNSMVRWHKQLKLFFVFVSVLKCSHCWYFYSYLVALNFLVYKNKRKKSKRNYRFHFSWYRFCIQTKIGFSQTKKLFILQR